MSGLVEGGSSSSSAGPGQTPGHGTLLSARPPARPPSASLWQRYNAYLRRPPEISVAWTDPATGARAWLVINSLRGGAAGGGTRMRAGVTPREVTYLAKTMELKFSVCGPAIGGGKNGIDFDPSDPRKLEVLERWYRMIRPYLREHYGTGGDLNVDEVSDVIPALKRLGIAHPQEGIVRGHLRAGEAQFADVIHTLDVGVKAAATGAYGVDGLAVTVSDMITGYGVARSVARLYERQGRDLDGARVLLEGFGNVGAAAALFLARAGARVVGIADAEKALLAPQGLGADEVQDLMRRRVGKLLPGDDTRNVFAAERAHFWHAPADVFVAAALSGTLTNERLDALEQAGVAVVACGANQPFAEMKLGSTRVQQRADRRFAIIPDVIANCGMARAFGYLMQPGAQPDDTAIFPAVERTIRDALDDALERAHDDSRGLLGATIAMTLDRIGG